MPLNSPYMDLVSPPLRIREAVGARARALRLSRGLRQADLAKAAGVALSTLKRFEAGMDVGFDVVVRVMMGLRCTQPLDDMFVMPPERSIDEILASRRSAKRSRARAPRTR
jgi:transcriptional regulator with XRE-family HTH domain